jgi:TolB protein
MGAWWHDRPAWSPDGRRLAFDGYPKGIYLMNADGSGQRRVTDKASESPAWSPDGRRIGFESNGEIYVINADGSKLRNLTHDPAYDGWFAWSPAQKK